MPAALAYLALTLFLQPTLVRALGSSVYAQDIPGNDALLLVWTLAWDQHALWTNPLGIFDANIFFPYRRTLLYSDHLIGLAVLLAPLRLLTDNPLLVHNLATVAAPALNAVALFALACGLGCSPGAAFVGGLAYGFAPLRLQVDRCHLGMLAAWWLPLVLLFARRAIADGQRRHAVLAGACLALQGLSGIYLTAFFLPLLALAHVHWLRLFPLRAHRRGWGALLVGEVAAALVLLPPTLAYRTVQRQLGVHRSIVVNALLSLRPGVLPSLVPALTLGGLCAAAVLLRRRLPTALRLDLGFLLVGLAAALVFALGPQVALPDRLGAVRAPYALLVHLPGLSALRAPGRMVQIALLCAAVLAAGGLTALTVRLGRPASRAVLALAIGLVLAECAVAPPPTLPMGAPVAISPVSDWLARDPATVRYAEFPTNLLIEGAIQQYLTTAHFRQTMNGSMGVLPPLYPYMLRLLERFPDEDVRAALGQLGITHVVAHLRTLPAAHRARIEAAAGPGGPLALVFEAPMDQSRVYRLGGAPPPPPPLVGAVLDRSRWHLTASHAAALASLAIDGDTRTAWSSWGDLEASLARWWNPTPFPERWFAHAASGPVWLAVDLGVPSEVGAVVLRLGGSDPLVSPELRLETSEDGGAWTPVPARLRPVPDVRALVVHADEARFALEPEAPLRTRHLRVSGPTAEWRVSELTMLAAPEPGAAGTIR